MKPQYAALLVLVMCAAAFAQVVCPPGTVAVTGTAATVMTPGICPTPIGAMIEPCPIAVGETIGGDLRLFVLGTQEAFPGEAVRLSRTNWRISPLTMSRLYPFNPLTSHQPNVAVSRHGNPYFPYIALHPGARVNGLDVAAFPRDVPRPDRITLAQLTTRYYQLTPQSAMAMGYQPVGVCLQGVGIPYVNPRLVDNVFDPLQPEAFTFSPDGRLLAVHYLVTTNQTFVAYGQQSMPSPLVPNAQQLAVWLFEENPNGLFALQSPTGYCPTAPVTAAVAPMVMMQQ